MGRRKKRNKTTSQGEEEEEEEDVQKVDAREDSEVLAKVVDGHLEDEEMLLHLNLPLSFGGNKIKDIVIEADNQTNTYGDVDPLLAYKGNEEDNSACSVRTRKRKKRSQKDHQWESQEHTSNYHTVYSDEMTVKEVLAHYPNGLYYHVDLETVGNNNKPKRILFDEDGQPILDDVQDVKTTEEMAPIKSLVNDESSGSPSPKPEKSGINLSKYKRQKYDLFHRFDEGILIDDEGWFSVTPEIIARHTASSITASPAPSLVLDCFLGVGGNAIQFALAGFNVLACDLSAERLAMAKHNAAIYAVDSYIDLFKADALTIEQCIRRDTKIDAVFLSPPWGGPEYLKAPIFHVEQMLPVDVRKMIQMATSLSNHVIYYLPRNTDVTQLARLLPLQSRLRIERHFLYDRLKVLIIHQFI